MKHSDARTPEEIAAEFEETYGRKIGVHKRQGACSDHPISDQHERRDLHPTISVVPAKVCRNIEMDSRALQIDLTVVTIERNNAENRAQRLEDALRGLLGVIDAHEIHGEDCDRRGGMFCDCLSRAVAGAQKLLQNSQT